MSAVVGIIALVAVLLWFGSFAVAPRAAWVVLDALDTLGGVALVLGFVAFALLRRPSL